jgi:hypothetical protein
MAFLPFLLLGALQIKNASIPKRDEGAMLRGTTLIFESVKHFFGL